jgi:DNA repair protein RecN (Recombination protein N)
MLTFLQISDYAIVDTLDLEFSEGFTCITGETGAGKSILVGALGLLCGARADTSTIRDGADRAELSAGFDLRGNPAAQDWLQNAELEDGTTCLLRRVITGSGRSRAWINGTAVTLQQLAELGDLLVEIHGQNEHIRLVRGDEQLRLLDDDGEHAATLAAVADACEQWRTLDRERQTLLAEEPLGAGELDLLRYQLDELDSDMLPAAGFTELESEHRALSRSGELLGTLEQACTALESEAGGASPALHRTADRLERFSSVDPDIAAAAGMLREAAINCDEALRNLSAAQDRLDLSPEHLADLERRLRLQHDLARKHRVEPEQLEQVRERLRARLERAGTLERRLSELDRELQQALDGYRSAARTLHQRRAQRAQQLAATVTELLQQLGMPGGRLEFALELDEQAPPSARGSDRPELRVSANPGSPPGPLRKVASGGELSRISLAIKVAARSGGAATQVFDEVDAGIGGETANAVGALLRSLAGAGQALCVTHLAQVAAFADQQISVLKTSDAKRTRVSTRLLSAEARVDEIARMLGGRLSAQSRAHASELLAASARPH